jgi:hypothetical protein
VVLELRNDFHTTIIAPLRTEAAMSSGDDRSRAERTAYQQPQTVYELGVHRYCEDDPYADRRVREKMAELIVRAVLRRQSS